MVERILRYARFLSPPPRPSVDSTEMAEVSQEPDVDGTVRGLSATFYHDIESLHVRADGSVGGATVRFKRKCRGCPRSLCGWRLCGLLLVLVTLIAIVAIVVDEIRPRSKGDNHPVVPFNPHEHPIDPQSGALFLSNLYASLPKGYEPPSDLKKYAELLKYTSEFTPCNGRWKDEQVPGTTVTLCDAPSPFSSALNSLASGLALHKFLVGELGDYLFEPNPGTMLRRMADLSIPLSVTAGASGLIPIQWDRLGGLNPRQQQQLQLFGVYRPPVPIKAYMISLQMKQIIIALVRGVWVLVSGIDTDCGPSPCLDVHDPVSGLKQVVPSDVDVVVVFSVLDSPLSQQKKDDPWWKPFVDDGGRRAKHCQHNTDTGTVRRRDILSILLGRPITLTFPKVACDMIPTKVFHEFELQNLVVSGLTVGSSLFHTVPGKRQEIKLSGVDGSASVDFRVEMKGFGDIRGVVKARFSQLNIQATQYQKNPFVDDVNDANLTPKCDIKYQTFDIQAESDSWSGSMAARVAAMFVDNLKDALPELICDALPSRLGSQYAMIPE